MLSHLNMELQGPFGSDVRKHVLQSDTTSEPTLACGSGMHDGLNGCRRDGSKPYQQAQPG